MNVFSDMDEFLEFKALMTDPDLLVSVKFAGTGFVVASLGDKANGYTVMCRALNFKEAVSWLRSQARHRYPLSHYVQKHPMIH